MSKESGKNIPENTIETFAKSFYKESAEYGFKQVDYLKFVNSLLDIAMKKKDGEEEPVVPVKSWLQLNGSQPTRFPLCGTRLFIRKAAPLDDKLLLEKWLSDKSGRFFLLSQVTAKFMGLDEMLYNKNNYIGIITLLDGTSIGAVAFLNHDEYQKKAELRKIIGEPKYRGKGFAKESTKLWLHYGLAALDLRKVYLNTLDTNIRNIKLNEELGFKVEGILRNEIVIDDHYHDVLRMGLRFED